MGTADGALRGFREGQVVLEVQEADAVVALAPLGGSRCGSARM